MRLPLTLAGLLGFSTVLLCSNGPVSLSAAAQTAQFRSGVQLLTIEATVRNKSGTPVGDLKPSDFTVTIDGKARSVVFAQFFHSEPGAIEASGDPTVGRYATNTGTGAAAASAAGHVVVFAIDRDALPQGTERPILESAAAMLDRLSPADSIGLVEIPGRVFDVTRDHGRIGEVLRSITGMPPPRSSARNVTWEEAKAFDRRDMRVIAEVYARECPQGDSFCPTEVQMRAREVLAYERAHAQTLLAALTSVITQLEAIRAPKHLVLVSTGLPFDVEFLDRFKMFEHAAAQARVTVDTIRMHEFVADASTDARAGLVFEDPMVKSGMDDLATMTGGQAFAPSGTAAGTFTRIVSDVTSFYQLGIESLPGDANGKLHDVKVHVNRPDVDTVARPSIVAPPPPRSSGLLDSALLQPLDVGGVPIAATTYSMFGATGAQRVVVAAEIGAPGSAAPAEWGAAVLHDGKPVASTRGRIPTGPERPQSVMTTMELAPGAYRLRVGAVDAEGGTGTLEIPFTAGAHEAQGGARISDLMVGVTTGSELEPRSRVADTDEISAIVEVAGAGSVMSQGAGAAGAGAAVGSGAAPTGTLQFVRGGTAAAAATVELKAAGGISQGPIALHATLDPGTLAPGRYTAVAVIRSGDQTLGRVSRVMDVTPGAAPAPSEGARGTAPGAVALSNTDVPASDVMKRVAAYVERYGQDASVLVGVEQYQQDAIESGIVALGTSRTSGPARRTVRSLTSEIALIRNSAAIGGWLAFRDVMEVDKKPVADRGARLQALVQEKTFDLDAAKKISDESARFNVGTVKRTFNVPTATLFFFTPTNLRRFGFKQRGTEDIDGVNALTIDFHEVSKPTLVMNGAGNNVPCSGTLWIDPTDGHVVQTKLVLTGYAGPGSNAIVIVTYRRHPEFDMWVPASMQEAYATRAGRVTAEAEYGQFRKFQTGGRVK